MRLVLLLLSAGLVWAAQDATITNAFTLSNASVPAQSGHCTVEFVMNNQPASPGGGNISNFGSNACGINLVWNSGLLQFYGVLGGGSGGISQYAPGTALFVVRLQVDAATKTDTMDVWDQTCTSVYSQVQQRTTWSGTNPAGYSVTATDGTGFRLAWLRLSTDTFTPATGCPTTAATGRTFLSHWKFEGNLNDSSGNGLTLSGGSPSYTATPSAFATLVVATACSTLCVDQPIYASLLPTGTAVSARAGFPVTLDGSGSFSQTDSSSVVSLFWQSLVGPSTPIWSSHTSDTPTLTGLVFGDYTIQMQATDAASNTATSTLHIGAVATDDNGVVVTGNSDVDFLLGSMIAFGQNPWGYQDYWHVHASALRASDYTDTVTSQGQVYPGWSTNGKPQWEFYGEGTVAYNYNCTGNPAFCTGAASGTTLNGSILATAATVTVNDASKLDLSVFPTRVLIYDGTNTDELRVVSEAANVLTLAFDPSARPRHAFANGVNVLQSKVKGTSTKFLTDATTAVCPVGVGPPGLSVYSTGTITLTANSATATGSGTVFTSAMEGDFIRVPATYSAGTPFVFVAQILTRNSATSLTLARVYPAAADTTAGLAYKIMPVTRTVVLEYGALYTDPTYTSGATSITMFGTTGCESETTLYTNPIVAGLGNSFVAGHDVPLLNGTSQTGVRYSITDTSGWVNQSPTYGINGYGEGIAHRSLYHRSGLTSAYDAAAIIDNYWLRSPWGNADGNGTPRLFLGGGGIGAFISKITDPASLVSWAHLRGYAVLGKQMVDGIAGTGCNAYADTRDSGYAYAWLVLAAIYDPDTVSTAAPGGIPWRTYWQAQLAQMQTNDTACQRADKSFANGFLFNTIQGPPLTLTNGSTAVTGVAIPTSMCNVTASGTATVVNGLNTLVVLTGSIPSGKILYLTGVSGGNPFFQALAYSGTGASATLGGNWLGTSGTISWSATNQEGSPLQVTGIAPGPMLTIASDNDDLANLQKNWSCTWNSSTSVTLNRNWDGGNGTFYAYVANLAGYGQESFMLGINSYRQRLLATQTVSALAAYVTPYTTFTNDSTTWIWDTGMDPVLLGTNYGRVFNQCEPTNVSPIGTLLGFRSAGCTFGRDPDSVILSREQNAEVGAALGIYYQNNPIAGNKTIGDTYYGALWGNFLYNTGGVYQDSNSTANNVALTQLADAYITVGKWYGFFAGIGLSSRWPAERLGGVLPADSRTLKFSFRLASVPNAAKVTVTLFNPDGTTTSATCSSSPCSVTGDVRQGDPLYRLQYLTSGDVVVATSDKLLVTLR